MEIIGNIIPEFWIAHTNRFQTCSSIHNKASSGHTDPQVFKTFQLLHKSRTHRMPPQLCLAVLVNPQNDHWWSPSAPQHITSNNFYSISKTKLGSKMVARSGAEGPGPCGPRLKTRGPSRTWHRGNLATQATPPSGCPSLTSLFSTILLIPIRPHVV